MSTDSVGNGRRNRWWIAIAAPFAVGIGVFVLTACGGNSKPSSAGVHDVNPYSNGAYQRILRATETATGSQAELAVEGESFFRSTALAKPGQACITCHANGGSSGVAGIIRHPTKAGDFTGPRTALPLWNVSKTAPYGWTGATPTLRAFSVRVIGLFFKDGLTQAPDVTAHEAVALTAFMNTLVPPVSAFDRGPLSGDALAGQAVFTQKCAVCHTPPFFSDGKVHNIGVEQAPGANDPGSAAVGAAPSPAITGGFNTPQLRDLKNIGPYFHNGIARTIDEVLDFYNGHSNIPGLKLNHGEKRLLRAYLDTL